jgi:hypothetical protein
MASDETEWQMVHRRTCAGRAKECIPGRVVTSAKVKPGFDASAFRCRRMPSHRIKSDLVSHFGDSAGRATLLNRLTCALLLHEFGP